MTVPSQILDNIQANLAPSNKTNTQINLTNNQRFSLFHFDLTQPQYNLWTTIQICPIHQINQNKIDEETNKT